MFRPSRTDGFARFASSALANISLIGMTKIYNGVSERDVVVKKMSDGVELLGPVATTTITVCKHTARKLLIKWRVP